MAVKAGPIVNLQGAVGPPSIVPVNAPPGPNVGVVGGYALWAPAASNGNVAILYGPKQSFGWTQTSPDAQGNTLPVGYQLTGAVGAKGDKGDVGAAGTAGTAGAKGDPGVAGAKGDAGAAGAPGAAGSQILKTSGLPANTVGNPTDLAIDQLQGFVYGPKNADGTWPSTPLVSTVGPAGPKGDTGTAASLPNDYNANSFIAQPVAGDANAVQIALRNSSGTTLFKTDASGNTTISGTLTAAGAAQFAAVSCTGLTNTGNESVNGTLVVQGASTLAGVQASSLTTSGNAQVGGTLAATGASTLAGVSATNVSASGTLGVSGTSTLAGVSATNVNASGTLGVSGTSTLAAVNATNVAASGTLSATGTSTLAAVNATNVSASGTLTASGAATLAAISATALTTSGTTTAKNLTLTSGAGGVLTFADGTTMATAASGTGGGSSSGTATGSGGGVLDLGFYWPNASAYPTSMTVNTRTITNGSSVATVTAANVMQAAGSVTGISGFIFGSTNGQPYTFTLYKNGVATAITASASSTSATSFGAVSGTTYVSSSSLSAVSYVAGDLLQVYSMAASGATSQATYSYATLAGGSSSSGGGTTLDTVFMGTFNAPGNFPTAYSGGQDAYFVNTQYSQAGAASRSGSAYAATYAGSVYSIQGYCIGTGTATGTLSVALYKNGVATSLVSTFASVAGGGPFFQAASTTSPVTIAVGDVLQLFVKSTTSSTANPLVGHMTLQPTGATSANTVARSAIDMGGYQYPTQTANNFAATKKANQQAGTNTNVSNNDLTVKMPFAGSIVGYSLQQNSTAAATTYILYGKNGTNLSQITAGTGTGNFTGTHALSAFPFAAGDKIQFLNATSNGGSVDVSGCTIFVQWTDAASATTGLVTNDPSFNSLKLAAVSGDTNPVAITYGDNTVQTTAYTGVPSRSVVHMGQITNSSINANAYYGLFQVNVNAAANPGTLSTIYGWAFKFPFAGAVTGYQLQQNINAGTNSLQYYRNGTSIATITAGSGTGNFAGTHANTLYRFAAGDTLTCATAISSGGVTAVHVLVVIEWLS